MAWQLDPSHSSIQFVARHMMLSKVRGEFEKFTVDLDLNFDNPENSVVEARIDASSINTREAQRDTHLKSPDFLNADQFPELIFNSNRVERTGEATAKLHGDLTIRGVTKTVVLDVEYAGTSKSPWGATALGFEASTKINREDWGLIWNVALETGGWLVGKEITIQIEAEFIQQS
ncbi:MAG: YceI family protein [Anaerolinea sp.]|jgi:polyisoprenoid-binding protein YceI|nr:YceI family protein [Anaerolinea sp.]